MLGDQGEEFLDPWGGVVRVVVLIERFVGCRKFIGKECSVQIENGALLPKFLKVADSPPGIHMGHDAELKDSLRRVDGDPLRS